MKQHTIELIYTERPQVYPKSYLVNGKISVITFNDAVRELIRVIDPDDFITVVYDEKTSESFKPSELIFNLFIDFCNNSSSTDILSYIHRLSSIK